MCLSCVLYMKGFIAKRVNSILVNLRYLRFKLLKYNKENNKKICNTFDHNFKNVPSYIMRKVSLERYYFVLDLYNGALTLKMSKMALNPFCDKTLHISSQFTDIIHGFQLQQNEAQMWSLSCGSFVTIHNMITLSTPSLFCEKLLARNSYNTYKHACKNLQAKTCMYVLCLQNYKLQINVCINCQ